MIDQIQSILTSFFKKYIMILQVKKKFLKRKTFTVWYKFDHEKKIQKCLDRFEGV